MEKKEKEKEPRQHTSWAHVLKLYRIQKSIIDVTCTYHSIFVCDIFQESPWSGTRIHNTNRYFFLQINSFLT